MSTSETDPSLAPLSRPSPSRFLPLPPFPPLQSVSTGKTAQDSGNHSPTLHRRAFAQPILPQPSLLRIDSSVSPRDRVSTFFRYHALVGYLKEKGADDRMVNSMGYTCYEGLA